MRAWLRRVLHRRLGFHRWRTVDAQAPHDFGLGQEMAVGTVRQCVTCSLCDWDTFVVVAPREGRGPRR